MADLHSGMSKSYEGKVSGLKICAHNYKRSRSLPGGGGGGGGGGEGGGGGGGG